MPHSPGPWGWYWEDHSMAILCGQTPKGDLDPLMRHVMSVSPCEACQERSEKGAWKWNRCGTPSEDDARLIAAAPDLYEALKWFIDDIDGTHTKMVEFDANVERARSALAKVEG